MCKRKREPYQKPRFLVETKAKGFIRKQQLLKMPTSDLKSAFWFINVHSSASYQMADRSNIQP